VDWPGRRHTQHTARIPSCRVERFLESEDAVSLHPSASATAVVPAALQAAGSTSTESKRSTIIANILLRDAHNHAPVL